MNPRLKEWLETARDIYIGLPLAILLFIVALPFLLVWLLIDIARFTWAERHHIWFNRRISWRGPGGLGL